MGCAPRAANGRNHLGFPAIQAVDAVVHMGDHAYNEGDQDERRADGYFQAFQSVLASCPWMPVVGNHEFYAGALLSRDLNSTWQGD